MKLISKTFSINLFLILILAISSSSANTEVVKIVNTQNNRIGLDATTVLSTGFMHPGATVHSSDWDPLTTANALADSKRDPIYISALNKGNYIKGINYGFNIPQNSIINGIEVMIEHATWNGNTGYYATLGLELQYVYKNYTTITGYSDKVGDLFNGAGDNFKNVTLGSSTDTWGRSWSVDDFSDTNFAVNITLQDIYVGSSESVDIAWVNVYYSSPPVPATVDILSSGNVSATTDNYGGLKVEWDFSYSFGDQPNLDNYVNVWYTINGSSYVDSLVGSQYLNNSYVIFTSGSSLYYKGNNSLAGNLSSLMQTPATYNFTVVAELWDNILAMPTYHNTSSVFVTISEPTSTTPTPPQTLQPIIQFDQNQYDLAVDINQIPTLANISVFPTLINATGYNFTDLTVYVMLNNSFQFSLSWQNASYNSVDLAQKINTVGYYEFALVFEATNGTGYYVNATVNVNLKVYDSTTTTDSTSSSIDTNTTTPTEAGNSTSLPELNLDFPFSGVAMFFLGFVAIVNYQRRKYQ